jgi:hypothetical protein
MAMGLLGQGRTGNRVGLWAGAAHVLGAAAGGAAVGGVLGWLGSPLTSAAWRAGVIAATALYAAGLSLWSGRVVPSRRCQLARAWSRSLPGPVLYFVWGALLGCGVYTFIPYSAYLVLLAGQLTAGPLLGATSGAVFGAAREAMAVLAVARARSPEQVMGLLPRHRGAARVLNRALVVAGLVLAVAAWR